MTRLAMGAMNFAVVAWLIVDAVLVSRDNNWRASTTIGFQVGIVWGVAIVLNLACAVANFALWKRQHA